MREAGKHRIAVSDLEFPAHRHHMGCPHKEPLMNATAEPIRSTRTVTRVVRGMPTSDGAGVKLTRVIGQPALQDLDPFLMLDEFGTDRPGDYIAGFPSHPHRGFETVTYMLDGRMRHKDNHGHEGVLVPGSVQWMTAGRGIVHSEMPEQQQGRMRGFQLWLNLPAREKMTEPKYQEYAPEKIAVASPAEGVRVKVIAGQVGEVAGPIQQPATEPTYLDIELQAGARFTHKLPPEHSAFLYVYEGAIAVGDAAAAKAIGAHELAVLSAGTEVSLEARAEAQAASRAILVAGRPLREPVAKYGPFVMNTQAEIIRAIEDFQSGRF
jgi:quercetin 2,3-dioxygenase